MPNITSNALTSAIVAAVIALAGAIAAALLFLRPKSKHAFKGLLAKLDRHVNFDHFVISKLLKLLYVFCALYAVVGGVFSLVAGDIVTGLLQILLAPVALRVAAELLLSVVSIREEARDATELLRRMQGLPPKYAQQPTAQPPQPQAAQPMQPRQRPMQGDPRYAAQGRAPGYPQPPASYADFSSTARRAPVGDFGMPAQRPAARPQEGYAGGGFGATGYTASYAAVRPNPNQPKSDFAGTARFSAVPPAPAEKK